MQVNYFGAVATLEGLRPLLARSDAPRAVVTASSSVLTGADPALLEACLVGDEAAAVAAAGPVGLLGYPTTKRAIARWVRREAPTDAWAGAGIALNAVAPGRGAHPDDQAAPRRRGDARAGGQRRADALPAATPSRPTSPG